jgi:poly(hydroxyalkanoate) depolymerase family esterase
VRVFLFLSLLIAMPAHSFNFILPDFGSLPGFNLPGIGGSTSNGAVYVPTSLENNTTPKPAIVVLHGCLQGGADVLKASQLKDIADKEGFYVITPDQSYSANPMRCWNWFDQKNQKRSENEVAAILNVIEKAKQDYPIDSEKIIISGFSAGAAMANVLAYCHADMFSGALIMAGVKYAGATSPMDAFNVMRSGSRISAENSAKAGHQCLLSGDEYPTVLPKFFIVAGTRDGIVAPINADQQAEANAVFYDLLDDSTQNNSVVLSGSKNIVKTNGQKRAYTEFNFSAHNEVLMKVIKVDGMSHGWSGGAANMQYSDPNGPAISEMMVDFFNL